MVIINGKAVYDIPGSCGTCPFLHNGSTYMCPSNGRGRCMIFDEWHHTYIEIPRRCRRLFKKALELPEGTECVITE